MLRIDLMLSSRAARGPALARGKVSREPMSSAFSPEQVWIGLRWTASTATWTARPLYTSQLGPVAELTADQAAAMHEAVPAIAPLGVSPIVRLPDLQA